MATRIDEILRFWFGDGSDPTYERQWFMQDRTFDDACRAGFLDDYGRAAAGDLDGWKESPQGALALILLLDQFPRNMFRNTPRAFATDARALATAQAAMARGLDLALPPVQRAFVYMPFEHGENPDSQQESMRLFEKLAAEHPDMTGYVGYARQHLEIIRRFGRFPARNAALGRVSTPAEIEFLRGST